MMRVLAYVVLGVLAGIGSMIAFTDDKPKTFLSPQVSYAETSAEMEDAKPWNSDDLLEMAKIYEQQADELQMEAVRLEQRATSLTLKPYLDPKGFRRTGYMHVAGARWRAAKELRELGAMHRAEGQRLLAMKSSEGA